MRIEYGGPDKVQVLPGPVMQPAKCVLCGAPGDGRPFVDIGCYLDFYGAVYFCALCIIDIANHLGYLAPSQEAVLQEKLASALSENNKLAGENDNFRNIIGTVLSFTATERDDFIFRYQEFLQWRDSQGPLEVTQSTGSDDKRNDVEDNQQGSSDVPDARNNESEQLEFDL